MIEEVLYEHLVENLRSTQYFATWNGTVAVFNQEAPADTDPSWGSGSQYGRIVFMVDSSIDPARKISSNLVVDVMCEKGKQEPEVLEHVVRDLIDGYFFTQDGDTMMAQWKTSNYFTEPNEKVIGVTISFNLLAFPQSETDEPDPVNLLNQWSSEILAEALGKEIKVIGYGDQLSSAWKPTTQNPAIYWRISQIGKCAWIPDTYNVSWQDATIQGHVFAADVHMELKICRIIDNLLQQKEQILFSDGSPLFVDRNIRINTSNDPLRTGQISVVGTYGLLRTYPQAPAIENISLEMGS